MTRHKGSGLTPSAPWARFQWFRFLRLFVPLCGHPSELQNQRSLAAKNQPPFASFPSVKSTSDFRVFSDFRG